MPDFNKKNNYKITIDRGLLGLGAIIIAGDSSIKLLAKVTGGDKPSYHPC